MFVQETVLFHSVDEKMIRTLVNNGEKMDIKNWVILYWFLCMWLSNFTIEWTFIVRGIREC